MKAAASASTHRVENQPPPLEGVNWFEQDRVLMDAVEREGGAWGKDKLSRLGAWLGLASTIRLGEQANRNPPVLRTHDRFGHRIDEVEFHPAWHELLGRAITEQVHALPWITPRPGAHVVRAAAAFLMNQVESGVCCPLAMTFAAPAALADAPALASVWLPKILSATYDPTLRPAADKASALIGMAMTEKQGGSDLRTNATQARALEDGAYELVGHKWFCSAPMSDAFLTLAQAPAGLSCFLVPHCRPDGTRNAIVIQRLKDKLGNRSNASAEIEYAGALAWLVGEEGHGVRTIIKMVHHTRLDAAISSAALMRQAVAQVLHHAGHRTAFKRRLIDQPLMRNVLADLALEVEGASALVMRLARAFDNSEQSPAERSFARLATAIVKYWVCKRAPGVVAEALECLGGNGYIEESILPRLYREAPVNSIWEGAGNIVCLDVLRAIAHEPDSLEALLAELQRARGADLRLDARLVRLTNALADQSNLEHRARQLVEQLALALQASILVQHAPTPVADAFCASRLSDHPGRQFGILPTGLELAAICTRARPTST
ncbi:MAG TPA: isovaleryl-CoA dehydrogenase [Geminicoccaceae bacterium]|jgi:putative acyl-CoA dehydrogenase|nr:isovaleryl-CoA dehydrogenase [Geminicoccaceae bacterium]HZA66222.1 isovaleryl-CoA dehydrogenase [Geminicoccaceae bacterium]